MAKLTLTDVGSTLTNTAANTINENSDRIEAAIENTLSRDGTTPNQMNADIDLNSNDLLNVKNLDADIITLNGSVLVPGSVTDIPPGGIGTNALADNAVTTSKIADANVTTIKIANGAITDALLNTSSNVGINNALITSPARHGGSITTMFAAAGYKIYIIPAGTYTFSAQFTIPAGSTILAENGAVFQPNFEPTGVDRATPLITLGAGVKANYLKLSLPTGIDTIRIGVKVQSNCQIDYFEATSVGLNNNRTEAGSTDLISGALLIQGAEHVRIGQVYLNRFDRGWTIIDSTDVVIQKIRNIETIMGGYIHGSRDIHVLAGYTTGPIDPNEPNPMGRGIMTPGANSLVLAGCSDSSFSNWYTFDMLEHGLRVGAVASGTTVPNHRLTFVNHKHSRPYGCGHKQDDADVFNIKYIHIQGLYTEDVGHDNWFGNPGYQNWSSGGVNDPLTDNDGNKVAFAIRNSQFVTFSDFYNRKNLYSHSGFFGLWIERSNGVQGSNIDTELSRHDGVVIQSGGSTSPERIELRGVATRDNVDSGLLYDASPSDATWRGVMVYNLDSQNNGGYGVEVTGRLDGLSPYATIASRIEGFVRGNTTGQLLIDSDVAADPDFVTDIKLAEGRATFDPVSLADGAGATTTVTVTGAALGDRSEVSFSNDLQGILLTSWVSAANTVSVRFQNETGGVIDLASGTLKARVRK